MDRLTKHNVTAELNAKFEKLAFDQNDGNDGDFLSGWQCENPFVSNLLKSVRNKALEMDHRRYSYFDAHTGLIESIRSHHEILDFISPQAIVCGCGSTSLLSTFAAYLRSIGVKKVYYIPPLYITLHTAFDRYAICTEPITDKQPYEDDFSIRLPVEMNAVLLLTDPVWIAGTSIKHKIIEEIAAWQRSTNALVFVDGCMQYMPWAGPRYEASSILDPSLTIRLVCPSKQLCIHGYRFSYLLVPAAYSRPLAWTYTSIFGPAPADSIAFGHEAIAAIRDGSISREIMRIASQRYTFMLNRKDIASSIKPECGYFVFVRILKPLPDNYICLDGSYFEQQLYKGYVKLNLLSPSLRLISEAYTIGSVNNNLSPNEAREHL